MRVEDKWDVYKCIFLINSKNYLYTEWEKKGMDPPIGYFSKLKAVLFSPREFFESIQSDDRIMPAYVFMLLSLLLYGAVFGLLFALIFGGFLSTFLGPLLGMGGALFIFIFILLFIGILFLVFSLFSFVSAGLVHLFIKLFGGQGSYTKTYQAIAYSTGVMLPGTIIMLIPFVGALAILIWQFVLLLTGLSIFHQISKMRAFCAWVLPLIIISLISFLVRVLLFESTVRTL